MPRKRKIESEPASEDPRYHDTWRLLKIYRDVVWNMELSVHHLKNEFEIEYGTSVEDFLESVSAAGGDLSGTELQDHARCIKRSSNMVNPRVHAGYGSAHDGHRLRAQQLFAHHDHRAGNGPSHPETGDGHKYRLIRRRFRGEIS